MNKVKVAGNIIEYNDSGIGHPVVFIHGAFSSGKTWRKVIPELSNHFRCIVPEWPFGGHKIPLSNKMDYTPSGIADFIDKLIEALHLKTVMVIANDTGGAYAQVFVAKYSHRVSHLVLSNCEGFEVFPPDKFKSLKTMVQVPGYVWLMSKLFGYKPSLKWDMTFGLLSHSLCKEEIYNFYVKQFTENRLIRKDFRKLASKWDPKYTLEASEKLSEFEKPVLILWGKDDEKLFPVELGKRLQKLFEQSTFTEVSGSMTYIQEDNPTDFIESVVKFSKENAITKLT